MGRHRKNSEELMRPRQVVADVQPLSTRPRRSAKDKFYDNLPNLTSKKVKEDVYEEPSPKPKQPRVKKEPTSSRTESTSSTESKPCPLLLPQKSTNVVHSKVKSEVVHIPIKPAPQSSNSLHHFLPELRNHQISLHELHIVSMHIDPRMTFSCDICTRRFFQAYELKAHLQTHVENIHKCSLCESHPDDPPFTMQEFTNHLNSHFIHEGPYSTCQFCGEVSQKAAYENAQHLLYYCPEVDYCLICDIPIEKGSAQHHRKAEHTKLLNRYVCTTCFLGFPSLTPFLTHICEMRYRCHCEMTDVYTDHYAINQHIDDCDQDELSYHGILVPPNNGRKRCFFVNPHSIMPESQNSPASYGFLKGDDVPVPVSERPLKTIRRVHPYKAERTPIINIKNLPIIHHGRHSLPVLQPQTSTYLESNGSPVFRRSKFQPSTVKSVMNSDAKYRQSRPGGAPNVYTPLQLADFRPADLPEYRPRMVARLLAPATKKKTSVEPGEPMADTPHNLSSPSSLEEENKASTLPLKFEPSPESEIITL